MEETLECEGFIAAYQNPVDGKPVTGLLMIAGIDDILPEIKKLLVNGSKVSSRRHKVFMKIVFEDTK